MRRRMREWLAETHGARFELTRHFAARLYDSEMFTTQGQWVKVAIGVASGLIPLAVLVLPMFGHRYGCVNIGQPSLDCPVIADYSAEYLNLVRSDIAWMVGLVMCITGLATAVEWQALFPSRRDLLALASLPVSAREMFVGKFSAVAAVFACFALAMNTAPAILFGVVIGGPWQANPSSLADAAATFAAMSGAAAFVFFSLLALQGLLLSVAPPRLFRRITVYLQAAVFTVSVGALPFLWPDAGATSPRPLRWFVDLWQAATGARDASARSALLAVCAAVVLALLSYAVSYGRHERSLLESPAGAARRARLGAGSRLLERWIREPREQAMFVFIAKTLARSRTHRLALLLYVGLGLAGMAKGIAEHAGQQVDGGGLRFAAAFLPLTAALFALLALRHLFSMPSELPANWIFRIAESGGHGPWLSAVERFTVCCVLAPIYLCGAPAAVAVFGWFRGAWLTGLGFAMALLVFEFLFRDWRKAPFTCSYQPGKRPAWLIVAFGLAGLSCVATASGVVVALSASVVTFIASFPVLLAVWWRARKNRLALGEYPLIFEDSPEPEVRTLDIEYERESQSAALRPGVPETAATLPTAVSRPPVFLSGRSRLLQRAVSAGRVVSQVDAMR